MRGCERERDPRIRYRVLIDYSRRSRAPEICGVRLLIITAGAFVPHRRLSFFFFLSIREKERETCRLKCLYVALRTSSANYLCNTSFDSSSPLLPSLARTRNSRNNVTISFAGREFRFSWRIHASIYRLTDYLHYSTSGEL